MRFDRNTSGHTSKIQMLPSAAHFDVSNRSSRNPILFSNYFLHSRIVEYFDYLKLLQFCIRGFAVRVAIVTLCVIHVVFRRTDSQVRGIYAGRIIALVMAHHQIIRNVAHFQFIHKAVRQVKRALKIQSSVSMLISAAGPKPAIIRFLHKFIQTLSHSAPLFSVLIARIRAVFSFFSVRYVDGENNTATNTRYRLIDLLRKSATDARTICACTGTKRKERISALLTVTRLRYSLISHFVFTPVENNFG